MKKLLVAALAALLWTSSAFAGKCNVTEFVNLPFDGAGRIIYIVQLSSTTRSQQVTYTTTTKSTALDASTIFVRVWCDSEAHIAVGPTSITATAASPGIAAGGELFFRVAQQSTTTLPQYVAIYDGSSP